MTTATDDPFLQLLERNPEQLKTPGDHIARAQEYAREGERAMAAQIRRGGMSMSPPFPVAFAMLHAKIAEVMLLERYPR